LSVPEYRNVETIYDFVVAARDTLVSWLLAHTDRDVWATEWCMDDPEWAFKEFGGKASNDWFEFDWKEAVYKLMAEDMVGSTWACPECDQTYLDGREIDCDCDAGSVPLEDPQPIIKFLEDCQAEPDLHHAYEALRTYGYDAYWEALEGVVSWHVDDMKKAVRKLTEAIESDSRQDMLVYAREATRTYHVNGGVLEDYGENIGLETSMVNEVRDHGFAEVFGRDDTRLFISGN